MTTDPELDTALSHLPATDLPPLAARTLRVAAQRRLALTGRALGLLERWEPALLAAFATAHLVWAVLQVVVTYR